MKITTLLLVLFVFTSGFSQDAGKETYSGLSERAVLAYKNGNLTAAETHAEEALKLSIDRFGNMSPQTAVSYTNLGLIFRKRKQFSKSIENLTSAAAIYEKTDSNRKLAKHYQLIGLTFFKFRKKKKAEIYYLKSISLFESFLEKNSKEMLDPIIALATFYARTGKYKTADYIYLRGYAIVRKFFEDDKESEQIERINDIRTCSTLKMSLYASIKLGKRFLKKREQLFGKNNDLGKVINGRAISLPKPSYPKEARRKRAQGGVAIKADIDEKGNVTSTKVLCGHPLLAGISEKAAKLARFRPTLMDGKPIKVTGTIIYRFKF